MGESDGNRPDAAPPATLVNLNPKNPPSSATANPAHLVRQARAAQPTWAAAPQTERNAAVATLLTEFAAHADELAELVTRDMGMPITRSRAQIDTACAFGHGLIDQAELALAPQQVYADASMLHVQYREPYGVVAAIAPWNFPVLNVPWQLFPALLTGNTAVFKPSELVPRFTHLLTELVAASELPTGVLPVLSGGPTQGQELVAADIDLVSFTGSTATARRIAQQLAPRGIPLLAETGGSAPGIVCADADLTASAAAVVAARFANSGQSCDALKRLLVPSDLVDAVLAAIVAELGTQRLGDPTDQATELGPLASPAQLQVLQSQIADAVAAGAHMHYQGDLPAYLKGPFSAPVILTRVTSTMRVWHEETFGPVLPVMTYDSLPQAIALANDSDYGLGAYVFTEDCDQYDYIARQLHSGMVAGTRAHYYSPATPFGAFGTWGRSLGAAGFHDVTQGKVVAYDQLSKP